MPKVSKTPDVIETHTFDASREPLGRIATKAATLLMGKHRARYTPNAVPQVRVTIVKSDEVLLTGKKLSQKRYYRHSGYIGNLREFSAEEMKARDSREIVRLAIAGMLPKNKLRKLFLKNVSIYKSDAPAHART